MNCRTKESKGWINYSLEIEVCSLKNQVENLEKKVDDQEQYLHKNCLLIHGLMEKN